MIAITMDFKVFILLVLVVLWCMKNQKIKVIFGEIRKIIEVTAISKLPQAIIAYYESKKKTIP